MSRFIVASPAPGHTGNVGGVHFQDGLAEVDDTVHPAELAYMRNAGYEVRKADGVAADPEGKAESDPEDIDSGTDGTAAEKPKKSASVADWRAYAVTKGLSAEDAEGLTKNQLVERFDEEDAS